MPIMVDRQIVDGAGDRHKTAAAPVFQRTF
jgi:hypothetical protein